MICPECGHGMFKHKMRCDQSRHDGHMCKGENCELAKYECCYIENAIPRMIFPDVIIYCGCQYKEVK